MGGEVVCEVSGLEGFVFEEGTCAWMDGLFGAVVPGECYSLLTFFRSSGSIPNHTKTQDQNKHTSPTNKDAKETKEQKRNPHGSSETQHLHTWPITGLLGSSGFITCTQSANLIDHPLYFTSSTNVLSLVGILNDVTPTTPSTSEALTGFTRPGPAVRDAKCVEEV